MDQICLPGDTYLVWLGLRTELRDTCLLRIWGLQVFWYSDAQQLKLASCMCMHSYSLSVSAYVQDALQ